MKKLQTRGWIIAGLVAIIVLGLHVAPASSHHSFAMYDQTKVLVLTGVAHQFVAQANHAELHFYLIGPDGKLTKDKDGKWEDWGVERGGRAPRLWRSKALRRPRSPLAPYLASR